jgi:hypothetical protein
MIINICIFAMKSNENVNKFVKHQNNPRAVKNGSKTWWCGLTHCSLLGSSVKEILQSNMQDVNGNTGKCLTVGLKGAALESKCVTLYIVTK